MNSNGGSSFFGSDWLGAFLIIAILFGGGGFGFGGRGPMPDVATKEFVQSTVNDQAVQTGLRDILLSSANNNYETAQLINGQTNTLMQQNNTNLINAIQGFNSVNISLQNLMAKMETCCCEIKTQMLQNRYDDERARNVSLQNEISNFQQSQYILNQMGRWVAWVGNGSQATTAASA